MVTYSRKGSEGKLLPDLTTAIQKSGLCDGMTISFHHSFREGDQVMAQVLAAIRTLGIRNLRFAPSAVVNVRNLSLSEYVRDGTITEIEASGIRGELGDEILKGILEKTVILRPHGGRPRAIENGELAIDVAFIGVSAADIEGNCTGLFGKNVCGPLGYSFIDAQTARCVVVVTDTLVEYPCVPMSISQDFVDYVVQVESVGDASLIGAGAARLTKNPRDLLIAERTAQVIAASRRFRDGFVFQTGAGAVSIACASYLSQEMKKRKVQAAMALGGIPAAVIQMYRDGLVRAIACSQAFDQVAAKAVLEESGILEIDNSLYCNSARKGCMLEREDFGVLGALEVDLEFNVNILTGREGKMLGGLGGGPDVADCAALPIVVLPIIRGRIPTVVEKVLTCCTPGNTVAAVVTEAGIALNPRHKHYEELKEDLQRARIRVMTIKELYQIARDLCGVPDPLPCTDRPVCVVQYRDGSVMDVIYQVRKGQDKR